MRVVPFRVRVRLATPFVERLRGEPEDPTRRDHRDTFSARGRQRAGTLFWKHLLREESCHTPQDHVLRFEDLVPFLHFAGLGSFGLWRARAVTGFDLVEREPTIQALLRNPKSIAV
jgi:hypothetical protein